MNPLTQISRYLIAIGGICILGAIYFPIWRIELDAPQYPEGLMLLIYSYKLGGQVDIVNGLNHYIGMKTLHAEEFIEFTILPYIFAAFGLIAFLVSYLKSRRALLILTISFIIFGILAMVDFWRWEYEYGHNLDPTAAIIVPGMAYQPPLIGFKQLLNFGVYSIPDIGGWLMILGGLIFVFVYLYEVGLFNKLLKSKLGMMSFVVVLFFSSCQPSGPEPININKDLCSFCKMTISEAHYAAELITQKGRIYKFDDIQCMTAYMKENAETSFGSFYVCNFPENNELIPAETAYYIIGGELRSPMAGNIAAFKTKEEAEKYKTINSAESTNWEKITE